MQTFSLKPGLAVTIDGRHMFYRSRLINNRLHFTDEIGEPLVLSEQEFFKAYALRTICILPEQSKLGVLPTQRTAPRDLSSYKEAYAAEALRRRLYIQALARFPGRLPDSLVLREIIEHVWSENPDSGHCPSVRTVRRWRSNYRLNSVVSLVPMHEAKGRKKMISGALEEILEGTINDIYLQEERSPVTAVAREFVQRVKEHNGRVLQHERLVIPCGMTIYRYIQGLEQVAVDTARLGKHTAQQKHRAATGQLVVAALCDRWEIDHTPLDIILVDPETGRTLGRPYLTVVLDRFSRMVMGYILHFAAPNTESVLRAIEMSICPKQALIASHGQIANLWPARGLPRQLVPDNAAEFHAGDLTSAFYELGIEILYPRSRGPQMKGAVERFFRTLAVGLIHTLPGTTFSNIQQKGDYKSEDKACLTFEQLNKILMKWIVDVYHQSPHKGLKKQTPAAVWRAGEACTHIQLPVDLDALESILARRKRVKIHHYGVEVGGHFYHSDLLADLKLRRNSTDPVDVRYRDDLGHVWVYDDQRKHFLQVPSKDKRLVGVSRDLYEAAKRNLKESGALNPNVEAILEACRQIQLDVRQARNSKKLSDRRRNAALKKSRNGADVPLVDTATIGPTAKLEFLPQSIPDLDVELGGGPRP